MNRQLRYLLLCCWLIALATMTIVCIPAAVAQDDPFGEAGEDPDEPDFGEDPKKPDGGGGTVRDPDDGELAGPEDPVVLAIRESNPTTPEALARAISALLDLDRPDEGKKYLEKLIALKPNDAAFAKLVKEFGTGLFLRIGREKGFEPEGRKFSEAALESAHRFTRDPKRLKSLVDRLNDPDLDVRRLAASDLRQAQEAAINPMLAVLVNPDRADEHLNVQLALGALGTSAVEPLIGALSAEEESVRIAAMEALGKLKRRRAVIYLLGPYINPKGGDAVRRTAGEALVEITGAVPTRREAIRLLERKSKAYLGGELPVAADHEQLIRLWHWDPKTKTVSPRRHAAAAAALIVGARAAADLYALVPDNKSYRRQFLLTNLESAKVIGGLDRPLPAGPATAREMAAQAGVKALNDVLTYAMAGDHIPAAIAAAETLADVGDADALRSSDGQPRPLVEALRHGDRRLRLAAAETIMKFDPQQTYPGSSRLPAALGYLAGAGGTRRALIAHPRTSQGNTLRGMLLDLGIDADLAHNGRRLFELAVASPDYEFLLISDAVEHPRITELAQMVRRDRRTASLPIGLMVSSMENLPWRKRRAGLEPLTEAFPQPQDTATMAFQVRRLISRAGRRLVPHEERVVQAGKALDHLATLAEDPKRYRFYDLCGQEKAVAAALLSPKLAPKAAHVLGLMGTPSAQRALVQVASQNARPLAQRQAAAKGFVAAVARRRVRLTTEEIKLQYERYNQSETLDPATQEVLGSILDAIEGKTPEEKPEEPKEGAK